MQFSKVFATVAVLATASACVSTSLTQAEAEQIAKSCRTEVGAVGTYSIRGGGDRMAATPVKGAYGLVDGTDAGAAALNACFKQKISGIPAATSAQNSVGCQKRSNPLQGGTGYC